MDLLFYLLKNIMTKRPEFKVILMSATIDPKPFIDYFKNFKLKLINVSGKEEANK